MARPQVADGGTASSMEGSCEYGILHKQSRTAYERWSSSLGVGCGADNTSPEKLALLRNMNMCLGPGLILWCDLSSFRFTPVMLIYWVEAYIL